MLICFCADRYNSACAAPLRRFYSIKEKNMARKKIISFLVVFFLLAGSFAAATPAYARSVVLSPVSYTTLSGGDGGQPVDNLLLQDQSGAEDDWDKYVEFNTPGAAYSGYRTYILPNNVFWGSATIAQITANYKGPLMASQAWTWQVYNWRGDRWETIGDNSAAQDGQWTQLKFTIRGYISNYVDRDTREMRVRLQSDNDLGDALLDYESLTIYSRTPRLRPILPPGECTRYVAVTGRDSNSGTFYAPWRTIQKAANTAAAGETVCVRAGKYRERVTVNVSGTAGAPITFRNYPNETAIIDGTGLAVPDRNNGLVFIPDRAYVVIKGFEIRNYRTATRGRMPVGIHVSGASHHIEIRNNIIHHIEHNRKSATGAYANGIAVYGTSGENPANNIIIDGNQLYRLKLGSSEALVINGNVDGWQVTNNIIHDVNNIGIDIIGFEETAPANDQARNGLVARNDIYNITSAGNPAYGTSRSAGCIYVDGGTQVVIEFNKAHNCNLGVEIASEYAGGSSSYITVRNNFIYNNTDVGISLGGYDEERGATENCAVVNNTLYNNNTRSEWGGELYFQYEMRDNIIRNNIVYANASADFIESWSSAMSGNVIDNNLYFSAGRTDGSWQWKNVGYFTFAEYQAASGNDANSLNGVDPLFIDAAAENLRLSPASPAIDAGHDLAEAGATDIDGQTRIQNLIDIGADEVR